MSKRHSNGKSNYNNNREVAVSTDVATTFRRQIMVLNSALQSRANLAAGLGTQFNGKRDIYTAAGYPKTLDFDDYNDKYERQDIAGRIVSLPSEWTWREAPEIQDGDEDDTEFIKAWEELTTIDVKNIADQKTIWHYLQRADKVSGIGRFGLLLIGISDKGGELNKPIPDGGLSLEDFLYLQPLDEAAVTIDKLDNDPTSPRFNLPETYKIYIEDSIQSSGDSGNRERSGNQQTVHWSRVIHIADDLKSDEIYGKPRLKGIFNLLNVLEKVTAGAGESAWQLMNKGYIASTKDGYSLDAGTSTGSSTSEITTDEVESFIHGLTRFLELEGMDVQVLGGEIVDPSGLVKTIITLISGETGIPQRLLLGNEQGQLASGQDERNWGSFILSRQKNFAEPIILRPLISRLIFTGILPEPTSGGYTVKWADTFKLNELEEAEVRQREASALADVVNAGMPIETYLSEFLGWSEDQIDAMFAAKEREEMFEFRDTVTGVRQ